MHFDRLDKIYAVVQSNLQFDKLVYTGLTGSCERYDRSVQIAQKTFVVPILGVNRWLAAENRTRDDFEPRLRHRWEFSLKDPR